MLARFSNSKYFAPQTQCQKVFVREQMATILQIATIYILFNVLRNVRVCWITTCYTSQQLYQLHSKYNQQQLSPLVFRAFFYISGKHIKNFTQRIMSLSVLRKSEFQHINFHNYFPREIEIYINYFFIIFLLRLRSSLLSLECNLHSISIYFSANRGFEWVPKLFSSP